MLIINIYVFKVLSQNELSDEEKQNCKYLNSIRANFSSCCQYPAMVVYRNHYNECSVPCKSRGDDEDCCTFSCLLLKIGVTYKVINDDGSTHIDLNLSAIIASFLLSVGNDSRWTDIVDSSVTRCYNQFTDNSEYDCNDRVPMYLYEITDCAYIENFLKCPSWNPKGLKECDYAYQYIDKCYSYSTDPEFYYN